MAILDVSQITELIKQRPAREKINAAIIQDTRLRFHGVSVVGVNSWNGSYAFESGYSDFLAWVTSFLKKPDKVDIFRKVLRPPHDSNELIKDIFKELRMSMDAQDKNITLEYSNPELSEVFDQYREDVQDDIRFFRKKVFSAVKSSVSSFLIVDATDREGQVSPYSYLLGAEHVIDYALTDDNFCEYIIFNAGVAPGTITNPDLKDRQIIAAIDQAQYWIFVKKGSDLILIDQVPHNIGWTPAKPIWSDKLDDRNDLLAESPVSTLLGALDWYLFFSISKRVIDTYGPWPIIAMFTSKCTYKDTQGNMCTSGWLNHTDSKGNKSRVQCPNCNNTANLVGAGSVVKVPAPTQQNNFTNYTADAIKFVSVETDILNYITEQKDNLHDYILLKAVGKDVEAINNQAVNEKQVDTGYESRHSVLANFAENMQVTHKFDLDTKNRIMFGDTYLGSDVSYGKKFFLRTMAELNEKYAQAKKAGASAYELKLQRDFIRQTEYRDNKEALSKMEILTEIEPFAEYSLAEISELQSNGAVFVSVENFIFKLNFNKFIQRFEREQSPINEFGLLAPKERRIKRIEEILLTYVQEELKQLKDGESSNDQTVTTGEGSSNKSSQQSQGGSSSAQDPVSE